MWIQTLPKDFTNDRCHRESNPRPLTLRSNALTTRPYAPQYDCWRNVSKELNGNCFIGAEMRAALNQSLMLLCSFQMIYTMIIMQLGYSTTPFKRKWNTSNTWNWNTMFSSRMDAVLNTRARDLFMMCSVLIILLKKLSLDQDTESPHVILCTSPTAINTSTHWLIGMNAL